MGVGGNFWDLLKPYANSEGFNFLRNKRVAVDLSYWIVQQETAIKASTLKPHLRLTFLRTINLFSRFGAFPVFVVDGTPSPLKSQARLARFYRASGIDFSSLPAVEDGVSIERNRAFRKCVQECVELLELLGMPVLRATGEAEALCAQLNGEGHVDACMTADSDAFLYGAKCVIKCLRPNCKEPFECYHMSDIEAGLGLKRKHLIAMSLLVGNDHDLNGIQGIGIDSAIRFVKSFSEHEILDRLREIGRGDALVSQGNSNSKNDSLSASKEILQRPKSPHCSFCGHPGSKKSHEKFACEYCGSAPGNSCMPKPVGFKCNCSLCDLGRKEKEAKKNENWQIRICRKIASEQNFPNNEIIRMLMSSNHGIDEGHHISWASPKTEMLVDYLAYHLQWDPSYSRQRMLPMLSTIFLRDVASNRTNDLLCGQYEFDSIQRVKIRYRHQFYVIRWKKPAPAMGNGVHTIPQEETEMQHEPVESDESTDLLDEPDVPLVQIGDGCCFLCSDEDMELVHNAFPEKVNQYLREKELREMKSRKKSSSRSGQTNENSESPMSKSRQPSITEFYHSSKVLQTKPGVDPVRSVDNSCSSSKGRRADQSSNYSKSARRRLLFG